jgi:hypothetical protein
MNQVEQSILFHLNVICMSMSRKKDKIALNS